MCGIFGQYCPSGTPDPGLIERMARRLAHRGPDGHGIYHEGPLAFGAGRLAIIDLSAPAGPILNEDGSIAIVYNGEVYNYRSLRAELEAAGHHFTTHTDTEVILHGYEQWGTDVLERLCGMFALCIRDVRAELLLLARDRLGKKPLYYTWHAGEFLFASEVKALFEQPGLRRAVNMDALPYYLTLGHVPAPWTLFEGIEKLAPGEMMVVTPEGQYKSFYWMPQVAPDTAIPYDTAVQDTRTLIEQAVDLRMISDVPVGAFLSGGIDSSTVVALMGRLTGHPVRTFTVGFDFDPGSSSDAKFNVDQRYAAQMAAALGTDHREITIRRDAPLDVLLPQLIYQMDEPVVQPAIIQTVFVSALARQNGVPVLLSGDGADELYAGYPHDRADRLLGRYLALPGLLRRGLLDPLFARMPARFDALRRLAEKSRHSDPVSRYLGWQQLVDHATLAALAPGHTPEQAVAPLLGALLAAPQTPDFPDRMAYTRLRLWLAEDSNMRVDKMAMFMSVEARAPFEDHRLVEYAHRLPFAYRMRGRRSKAVLKDAAADLLPPAALQRPKWGFFQPSSSWLRTLLKPLVDAQLAPERVEAAGVFDPQVVARLVQEHTVQDQYRLWPLWLALTFQVWHALYIEQSLDPGRALTPADLYSGRFVRVAGNST